MKKLMIVLGIMVFVGVFAFTGVQAQDKAAAPKEAPKAAAVDLAKADANKDGKVTEEEFVKAGGTKEDFAKASKGAKEIEVPKAAAPAAAPAAPKAAEPAKK